ncbi:MAG: methionine aminotransferase [Moheibacter sp.]
MNLKSKLPQFGTTIFTVMSQLANEQGAVNLSQGFPDFDCSPDLVNLVNDAMKKGLNQYSPMSGVKELREQISRKQSEIHNSGYHPDTEVTVTAGGAEALFSAIAAVIRPDDEAIIFEPAYDLYRPAIELFGGIVKSVKLIGPDFQIDWEIVKSMISSKTKLIIINNPNNPATSVLTENDFMELAKIVRDTDIAIISDEVYEHIVFDGLKHLSISRFPELKERSFVIASFGKLYHITGWKVGYCLAPEDLAKEFRKVHQFNVFCVNTPVQYGLAEFLKRKDEYLSLPEFFRRKRDFFIEGMKQTPFKILKPKGSYFLLADYSEISDLNEFEFSKWLTENYKVAVIPVSAFYNDPPEQKLVRFCFAKKEETMERAIEKLIRI